MVDDAPVASAPELDVKVVPEETAEAPAPQPTVQTEAPTVPDWLFAEPAPQREPAGPPQPPPAPTYSPPPFMPPHVDSSKWMENPNEAFWQAHIQANQPVVAATLELAEKVKQIESQRIREQQDYLYNQAVQAKSALRNSYTEFQRDPSFANPAVRTTLDNEVKNFYGKALRRLASPDPSTVQDGLADLAYMRSPQFRAEALRVAKTSAGYPGGQTPKSVPVQGGRVEGVTPTETGPEPEIPPEMLKELHKLGPGYEKRYRDNLKTRKKMGWEE